MAELNEQETPVIHGAETHQSLSSLLCNEERDFLIRNNGHKVRVKELEGKYVGLYFSAHWCPPCRYFTPVLSEIYKKLLEKGDFEIVFISADRDEKSFEEYHHTMPWLALPFSDENTRKKLDEVFQVNGITCLVLLDKEGRVITTEGVEIIEEHGVEGYPFTAEILDELRAKDEALRAAQTIQSLLLSDERDFVIGHGGRKVPVVELVGKTVGLYFSAHWCGPCRNFTPQLVEIYNELLKKGEAFEIVFLSGDKEEKAFEEYYASMPWLAWLALPFADYTEKNLSRYFRVEGIPTLIILGPDGKTVQTDTVPYTRIWNQSFTHLPKSGWMSLKLKRKPNEKHKPWSHSWFLMSAILCSSMELPKSWYLSLWARQLPCISLPIGVPLAEVYSKACKRIQRTQGKRRSV